MSFSLEKKPKEVITIYGKDYEVRKPSVKQMVEFMQSSKEDGFNEADASIELLSKLGLPADLVQHLDADDFTALTKYLFEPKKK